MDFILPSLLSSDVKVRIGAVEAVLERLQRSSILADVPVDVKFKIMSACVHLMKDANAQLAQLSLDCVQIFVEASLSSPGPSTFAPLCNTTFEILLNKFSDLKSNVRTRSMEVALMLIEMMGLAAGIEKLLPHLAHRNWRIREQILYCIQNLITKYKGGVLVVPDIGRRTSILLQDAQESVRQVSMEVLAQLFNLSGEKLVDDLAEAGVRPILIKQIRQLAAGPELHASTTTINPSADSDIEGYDSTIARGHLNEPLTLSGGVTKGPAKVGLQRALSDPTRSDYTETPKDVIAAPVKKSAMSTRASLAATAPPRGLGRPTPLAGVDVEGSETSPPVPLSLNSSSSRKYSPEYFFSILVDGSPVPSLSPPIYTEKDLADTFNSVQEGLTKPAELWEDRIAALSKIQSLVCGNAMTYDNFTVLMRGLQEQIPMQITDLRSTVSKEGCRTAAILSNRMGTSFGQFAELWIGFVFKIIPVKIQVISVAADRASRSFIYCLSPGHARLTPILLEHCANKNAAIRKVAFECLNIALARWKIDSLDKNFTGIRQVVASGVADADANVRKAARLMFWVIKRRGGSWSAAMDAIHANFDDSTKKHVKNEAESSFDDMTDLFRKPDAIFPLEKYFVSGSSSDDVTKMPASSRPPTRVAATKRGEDSINRPISQDEISFRSSSESAKSAPHQETTALDGPTTATHHTAVTSALSGGAARANLLTGPSRNSIAKASASSTTAGITDSNTADSKSVALAAARELRESRTGMKRNTVTNETNPLASTISTAISTAPARRNVVSSSSKEDRGFESTAGVGKLVGLANGPMRISRPAPAANKSGDIVAAESTKSTSLSASRLRSSESDLINSTQDMTSIINEVSSGLEERGNQMENNADVDSNVNSMGEKVQHCSSLNELRAMIVDPLWDIRLKALLQIRWRVCQSIPPSYFKDDEFIGPSKKGIRAPKDASTHVLPQEFIDVALDLSASKMSDPHIRVQAASLECILLMIYPIEYATSEGRSEVYVDPLLNSNLASTKLGYLLPALFARLADRRPKIRDQANEILNHIKISYDSNIIMASLSPRLSEVTDRIRTSVIQFLQPIVPLCEKFFVIPANTLTFLNRMAYLLGSGGINKPSTAFVLSSKRILELVHKVCPQMVLAQVGNLSSQDQQVIKKQLQGVVANIDNAVLVASRAETQRLAAEARGKRAGITQESKESAHMISSLSAALSRQEAEHDKAAESVITSQPIDLMESSMYVGLADAAIQDEVPFSAAESVLDDSIDSVERVFQDMKSRLLTPRSSLQSTNKFTTSASTDFADPVEQLAATLSDDTLERSLGLHTTNHSPTKSQSKTPLSSMSLSRIDSFTLPRPPTPGDVISSPSSLDSHAHLSSPGRSASKSISKVSPISHQNKDVVWLLRCLGGTNFLEAREERTEAINMLKALIKDETPAFWERNFAQIVSLLLDVFTPVGVTETLYASAAAAGESSAEELERIRASSAGSYAVGGATNGLTGYSPMHGRVLQAALENNPGTLNRDGLASSPVKTEAGSSSTRTASTLTSTPTASATEDPARIARMEYLHQVCRLLLLIVRHRGAMLLNFLELLCCRLCEAAAFAPLAITMHCEQILAAACTLDPVSMARALSPYTHYGSSLEPDPEDSKTKLSVAMDVSRGPSPTSYVRLLALRVLAQCVSHLTSPELITALPMITACVIPSFRSSLVDIRQAVVQVLVNAYVLVGDVLYPYIKELPPQQKKLLTIYIERQMKKTADALGNEVQ